MSSPHLIHDIQIGSETYGYFPLTSLGDKIHFHAMPFSYKIVLENLLRGAEETGTSIDDIRAIAQGQGQGLQIAFKPTRVVLQDFTGVPAVVDLAAMRDALAALGGDPQKINPQVPVDLVIDHSVMVDFYGDKSALTKNTDIEFQRNQERYNFLRWGQQAFDQFQVVPPGTGIVHQVNLEFLADVVSIRQFQGRPILCPDTLVGTDSHTTMINGLGVLGWGVGGIEAEAAMLGQPVTMMLPDVVGFRLDGTLPEGTTATDLVLTVTQMLRSHGVVGKFVEFFGPGVGALSVADRATIANMAPEYGATVGLFPVDEKTIEYLRLTGREDSHLARIELYCKTQGLWRDEHQEPRYSQSLQLNLNSVEPCIAGPKRPQDRVKLKESKDKFQRLLNSAVDLKMVESPATPEADFSSEGGAASMCDATSVLNTVAQLDRVVSVTYRGQTFDLTDGAVVIAAITSCTNTSNPAVMIAAGLLARNARKAGLNTAPWVKTSLAPGSQVVPAYLAAANVQDDLDALGFQIVGFGCTTCIGNSGPLPEPIREAVQQHDLFVASVLSGNRNFEGRIHADVKSNYLASPPLVVAYALAGTMKIDLTTEPLGVGSNGQPVYLKDIWPSSDEVAHLIACSISQEMFKERYQDVFSGPDQWRALEVPKGQTYDWPESTYIRNPPFFEGMTSEVHQPTRIVNARCLVKLGDSITTDHISPAGAIHPDSPAGQYLQSKQVPVSDFNSLGSRRGNHEVMMRGTFANVRLQNELTPDTRGGRTKYWPTGETEWIYDAAMKYKENKTPLIVLGGKEYGTGSSRDWAAKGTRLLGIQAVIAESYERIHRSNLVGFGVLPLQFQEGESAKSLGLTGEETFSATEAVSADTEFLTIIASDDQGRSTEFKVLVRIDTPMEWDYYQHGGILHAVLRRLATS